jgi:sigma-E factor negative regulatory protein RseA
MENMDKREMISALADGQLAGEAFAQGVELASTDAVARDAWHAYHLIGDVLRSSDLAAGAGPDAFLARLQARLRDEQPAAPAAPLQPIVVREAANDFRWKVVAGVASVAALSAIAWSLVSSPGGGAGAQFAKGAQPANGVVLTSTQQGVMMRDPRLDELLATHRQLGGAQLMAPAGSLRNATFDTPGR